MPIYEYRCLKCKAVFEQLEKMHKDGEDHNCPKCPKCGKGSRRVFSRFAFSVEGLSTGRFQTKKPNKSNVAKSVNDSKADEGAYGNVGHHEFDEKTI